MVEQERGPSPHDAGPDPSDTADLRRRASSGFTLIELLVTVTIVGILASIAIPALLNSLDRGKQAASVALIRSLGTSMQIYYSDNGKFPQVATTVLLLPHLSPYADSLRSHDDWKHPLDYQTDGEKYTLECFGKDGIDGTNITPQRRHVYELDIVYSMGTFINSID